MEAKRSRALRREWNRIHRAFILFEAWTMPTQTLTALCFALRVGPYWERFKRKRYLVQPKRGYITLTPAGRAATKRFGSKRLKVTPA
jgi:hypothetical protein